MTYIKVLVLCVVISQSWCLNTWTFPEHFKFGAATAAYQVEGAWNVSAYKRACPQIELNNTLCDVACDSYHLWKIDIQMAKELGLDIYRFSISWPRLLPSGFANHISEDGASYYNNLIDGLLAEGIEPVVTMYHWDLPQSLQVLGGWANPLIVDWFVDYARVVFTLFANRVKIWITINEPLVMWALYLDDMKIGGFLCNKNVLLAHAKAYRVYDEEFRSLYGGKVSMSNIFFWLEPESPKNLEATELMF